jgi:hypothetical protein
MLTYLWSILGHVQRLGTHGVERWDNQQIINLRGFGMMQSSSVGDNILTRTYVD